MNEFLATITAKGRVTVQGGVPSALGVTPGDNVAFAIDDSGKVEIRSARYTMAGLSGVLPALNFTIQANVGMLAVFDF